MRSSMFSSLGGIPSLRPSVPAFVSSRFSGGQRLRYTGWPAIFSGSPARAGSTLPSMSCTAVTSGGIVTVAGVRA